MDQGVQQVPRRVASGYFSLIFFIVLCLALVAGYVPVVLQMQKKTQDLAALQSGLKNNVADPLRDAGQPLTEAPLLDGNTVVYGPQFFTQLSDVVQKGAAFPELAAKVGFGEGPTAPQEIEKRLASATPRQASLKEMLDALEINLRSKTNALAERDKSVEELRGRVAGLQTELENARKDYVSKLKEVEDRLDSERAAAAAKTEELTKMWDAANEKWKELWNKYQTDDKTAKDSMAGQKGEIEALDREIARLRDELKVKKPAPKPGPIGKVLKCDLKDGFVIIDRGSRDNMAEGQELLVYRSMPQGKKDPVGNVVVVRVFDASSRADIAHQDEMHPILPEDLLYLVAPEE